MGTETSASVRLEHVDKRGWYVCRINAMRRFEYLHNDKRWKEYAVTTFGDREKSTAWFKTPEAAVANAARAGYIVANAEAAS